jgi:geranylgeranyl diphosphate synthase, type I
VKRVLGEVRQRVEATLARFLAEKRAVIAAISPELEPLVRAAETLTLRGGKRLRPALTAAGYACVAPIQDLGAVVDAGASFELLQTFLLIQDDWMDRDEVRRGGPSVHAMLHRELGDEHRAASIAIIASDLSCAWAFEILGRAAFAPDRLSRATQLLASAIEEVALGQHLDVIGSRSVETVHLLKTAGYTVRWPLRLGAILAGASEPQLVALDRAARPLGLAFQLRDDLLGTFGDPAETGKPASSDLREGKESAVIAEARLSLSAEERERFEGTLGRTSSDEELSRIRALLEDRGVRAKIERRIDALLAEGHAALEEPSLRAEGVEHLRALAELIVSRKV